MVGKSVAINLAVLCKVVSRLAHEKYALTPVTLHNELLCIMNRFLSSLRSRVLKNIELSRGVGIAENYGDCNRRAWLCGDLSVAVRRCED